MSYVTSNIHNIIKLRLSWHVFYSSFSSRESLINHNFQNLVADALLGLTPEHGGECLMLPPGWPGVGAAGVRHRVQEGGAERRGRRGEAGGGVRTTGGGLGMAGGDYLSGGLGKWLRMACVPACVSAFMPQGTGEE